MGITYTNMRIYDITEADKENLTTILNECELDEQYRITRLYQHFILMPAILYGNVDAPLTKPLTMTDIVTQLSNIAIGVTGKNEVVDAKTKIAAMLRHEEVTF